MDCCQPISNCGVAQCTLPCPSPHVPNLDTIICPVSSVEDRTPKTEKCYVKKNERYGVPDLNSLGAPIGIIKAPNLIKSDGMGPDVINQRYATCLKAFSYLYLSPEYEWTAGVLGLILKEGQKLVGESKKGEEIKEVESEEKKEGILKSPSIAPYIYSEHESRIKRSFDLLGSYFDIELSERYGPRDFTAPSLGDAIIPHLYISNLKPALKAYFKTKNYCLVEVNGWYLLIWKANGVYFAFDVCGRRLDTFETDINGFVILMCLKTIDNINHLIVNLSGLQTYDVCTLREMRVIRMSGPYGVFQIPEYGERENEFVIVSSDYAYLTSPLHLTLKIQYPLRSRSALPVAVAAILASKIDHPGTWTEKQLSKIICYGVNVCRYCWEQCLQQSESINFDCFPDQFRMGQFLISFKLKPIQFQGTWRCVPKYENTELTLAIKKFFNDGIKNLIIQINQQVYAVWLKNDFVYFLDPYRHRIMATNFTGPRSASLRIFRTIDAFLYVFNYVLLQSNRKSKFYIHTLHIRKIELDKDGDCVLSCLDDEGDDIDILSLNEAICFKEDDKRCLEELGQISDDDEEDSLEEEEIPESELEPEHAEEEGGGAVEDIGDISSSEDGGIDDRRRRNKQGGASKKKKIDKKKKNKRSNAERKKRQGSDKDKDKDKDKKREETDKRGKKDETDKPKEDTTGQNSKDSTDKTKIDEKEKEKDKKPETEEPPKILDKKPEEKPGETPEEKSKEKPEGKPEGKSQKGEHEHKPEKENKKSEDPKKGKEPTTDSTKQGEKAGMGDPKKKQEKAKNVKKACKNFPSTNCSQIRYPGQTTVAHDIVIAASEYGTYDSICKLLRAGFHCADRVLIITPYGSYVVFHYKALCKKMYFIFDGCTCNLGKFRQLDICLNPPQGLQSFTNLHDAIKYIIDSRRLRNNVGKSRKDLVEEICHKYCPE